MPQPLLLSAVVLCFTWAPCSLPAQVIGNPSLQASSPAAPAPEGWVAKDQEAAAAGLWVRAFDAQRQSRACANTYEQALPADRQLRRQRLEFAVPAEAAFVLVGASIYGASGSAWFGGIDARLVPAEPAVGGDPAPKPPPMARPAPLTNAASAVAR